jgi:adenylate kinase family enzyme
MGHSNSGKTPLGSLIEDGGSSRGSRFHHLDFGETLRRIADGSFDAGLASGDIAFVRSILDGRLLDDEHFRIAAAVLDRFLTNRGFDPRADILVLNGIPRHPGQARDLERLGVDVELVVYCACSPQDALERKLLAEQGVGHEDRSHRKDYDIEIFRRKVRSFERDTEPVLRHYRRRGVGEVRIEVGARTTGLDAYEVVAPMLERLRTERA